MDKHWLKKYPSNLDENLGNLDHDTVADLIESSADKFTNKIAFSSFNTNINFKMLNLLSKRLAAYMQFLGVNKKTKIAIMLPNLLTYPVTLFGTYFCGATVVNINPLYKSREIEHTLIDSKADYIFVLDKFFKELEPCIKKSNLKGIVICRVTDLLNPLIKLVIGSVLFFKKESIKIKRTKGIIFFKDIISNNFSYKDTHSNPSDIALLQYTGGTTGKSKAAILTHKNLISNIQQVHNWIKPHVN